MHAMPHWAHHIDALGWGLMVAPPSCKCLNVEGLNRRRKHYRRWFFPSPQPYLSIPFHQTHLQVKKPLHDVLACMQQGMACNHAAQVWRTIMRHTGQRGGGEASAGSRHHHQRHQASYGSPTEVLQGAQHPHLHTCPSLSTTDPQPAAPHPKCIATQARVRL